MTAVASAHKNRTIQSKWFCTKALALRRASLAFELKWSQRELQRALDELCFKSMKGKKKRFGSVFFMKGTRGFALRFECGVEYGDWIFFGGSSSLNRPARGSRPTLSWCWQRTRLEAGCWLLVKEQEQNPSLTVAHGPALRNYYREPTSTPRPRWRRPCRPRPAASAPAPRRRRAGAGWATPPFAGVVHLQLCNDSAPPRLIMACFRSRHDTAQHRYR